MYQILVSITVLVLLFLYHSCVFIVKRFPPQTICQCKRKKYSLFTFSLGRRIVPFFIDGYQRKDSQSSSWFEFWFDLNKEKILLSVHIVKLSRNFRSVATLTLPHMGVGTLCPPYFFIANNFLLRAAIVPNLFNFS